MPTIKQLPLASSVQAGDVLPVSQGAATRGLTVGALLSSTQPAIALVPGRLIGRVSASAGGPESVALGGGLALAGGSLSATGGDHLTFPAVSALLPGDEVVVNSGGGAKRVSATALRGLFSAGGGVSIDASGQISASVTLTPATAGTLGTIKVGSGLSIAVNGTLTPDGSIVALRSALSAVASSGSYGDLMNRPSLGQAAARDVGTVSGTVADGGVVAAHGAALASAITVGGAPIIASQAVAVVSATGSTQADAIALSAEVTVVGDVALGSGTILPNRPRAVVLNRGANPVRVYPPSGGSIEGTGSNVAIQMPAGSARTFVTADNVKFFSFG